LNVSKFEEQGSGVQAREKRKWTLWDHCHVEIASCSGVLGGHIWYPRRYPIWQKRPRRVRGIETSNYSIPVQVCLLRLQLAAAMVPIRRRGDVQYYRVEEWFRRGEKMHHKFQKAQDEKTAARPRRLSREAPRHGSWRDESWHARLQESAKAEEWMVGTCRKHIISNRLHRSRSKSADTAT
jgi:hypothetical protein